MKCQKVTSSSQHRFFFSANNMIIYIVFNRKFRLFIIEFLTPWMNKRRRRYASFRRRVGSCMLKADVLARVPLSAGCTCRPSYVGPRMPRPSLASLVCPFHSSSFPPSTTPLVVSSKMTTTSGKQRRGAPQCNGDRGQVQ